MKKYYLLSVLGLFMTLTTTLAQPLREGATPTEPPALRTRKASAPFLGITVNVPLWKIFGTKKAKVLPQLPKASTAPFYVEERSPVVPEPMNAEMEWDTTGLVVSVEDPYEPMYDLDPVTVTAPRLPGYGGGGSAPGGGITSGGEPLPPVQYNPVGDPPSGNYVPPTQEELLQNCQRCKADARAIHQSAINRFVAARNTYNATIAAVDADYKNRFLTCVGTGGILGGMAGGVFTWATGAAFVVTATGMVAVGAIVLVVGGPTAYSCYTSVEAAANRTRVEALEKFTNAVEDLNKATRDFEEQSSRCGSCH